MHLHRGMVLYISLDFYRSSSRNPLLLMLLEEPTSTNASREIPFANGLNTKVERPGMFAFFHYIPRKLRVNCRVVSCVASS